MTAIAKVTTKALTLWEPWASLCALGVKTIETRSWSTKYRGRLILHASKHRVASWTRVGEYRVQGFGRHGLALVGPDLPEFRSTPRLEGYILPLGKIVATCELLDVIPIIGPPEAENMLTELLHRHDGHFVINDRGVRRWHRRPGLDGPHSATSYPVRDEDYGDFTPGRYAWILGDVKQTSERCPACWGTKSLNGATDLGDTATWLDCPTCDWEGECAPIPAKGRQGLWNWSADDRL